MADIQIFSDDAALADHAAALFAQAAGDAIAARGRFTVALAGGTTPEKTYRRLAQPPYRETIDWARTFVFLGDERFVPSDDPRSNYGMARRSLLIHVPLPDDHVFPVSTDAPSAEIAASEYANTLARFFGQAVNPAPPPFDLILLGLGDDGHTASLFPRQPSLGISDRWVVAGPPGTLPPPVDRVTFTFPLLNAARQVVFLVAGEKKAPALRAILEGGARREEHPAAGVEPTDGLLTWLLDEAAASLLRQEPGQTS